MNSLFLRGFCLAIFGGLTVAVGHWLGLDLDQVALLGVALGGAVGLVPDRSLAARVVGFLVGFVVAWVGYGLRAAVLPDTDAGRGVVVTLVLAALMLVSLASAARLPLWSLLLGSVAIVGAYEETYIASPSEFLAQSPVAASTILLAVALGVLGSLLVAEDVEERRGQEKAVKATEHRAVAA